MFVVTWSVDGKARNVVTSDNETAWEIYWMVKKSVEGCKYEGPCHLRIFAGTLLLDPRQGSSLPPLEDQDPYAIQLNPHYKENN